MCVSKLRVAMCGSKLRVAMFGSKLQCVHHNIKLRAVAGAEEFWVAELRVRQLKIGSKSCFGIYQQIDENWAMWFAILTWKIIRL